MYSKKYFAAVRTRAHVFKPPSSNFDRLGSSDDERAVHGLPPRPDPLTDPTLHDFWKRLLSPPFTFVIPEFPKDVGTEIELQTAALYRRSRRGLGMIGGFRGHGEASSNWSGAYITPRSPNSFRFMVAGWKVPTIQPPKVSPDAATTGLPYRSSVWIGFDGHRGRYPQASLPQIGTAQDFPAAGGTANNVAWWQWWKHNPDPNVDPENERVDILNLPVGEGHEILTGMRYRPQSRDVNFFIKNQSTGLFCTFVVIAPGHIDPVGTTAEWIVERPTEPSSTDIDPLPNFGAVDFSYCIAQSASEAQPLAPPTTQTLDGNARYIRMRETFSDPHRSAFVSLPKKTSATSLRCTYAEPGRTS